MITDNKTVYENGKYRLNEDYVLNYLGIDLKMVAYDEFDTNPSTLPERILTETSDMIYSFMRTNCKDYRYACELIEEDAEFYDLFVSALKSQLEAFILKGDQSINGGEMICKRANDSIIGLLFKRRPPSFKITGRFGE